MILVTALWAKKRDEFVTIWNGSFYDSYLATNYRVNSFFKQEKEVSMNMDIVDKSVFSGLKANEDDGIYDPLTGDE